MECIESISLRWTMEADSLYGKHTSNGIYSVKSGYFVANSRWNPTKSTLSKGGGFVEEHMDRRCITKMQEFGLASFFKYPPSLVEFKGKEDLSGLPMSHVRVGG